MKDFTGLGGHFLILTSMVMLFRCLFVLPYMFLLNANKNKAYWIATIGLNLIALSGTFSKTSIANTAFVFIAMSLFLPLKRKVQLLAISACCFYFINVIFDFHRGFRSMDSSIHGIPLLLNGVMKCGKGFIT
ncbi:MAG: hypothetical protein MZV70_76820 [Desulfobacterales bacterium]|nr:hypothetical protein [Desulfobacterales bacterium]